MKKVLVLMLAGGLSACVTQGMSRNPWPYPEPPTTDFPSGEVMPGVPAPRTDPGIDRPLSFPQSAAEASGPAVVALMQRAEQDAAADNPDAAAASLERALRIEPRNAFVWQALAQVRLQQDLPDQALSLVQKSSSLGRGNPYLEADNWWLTAAIQDRLGDQNAAAAARARAAQLSRDYPRS